jgi:hypothetical protein
MSKSVGMPYIMACCFMNPCNVRNIGRYQYRLRGNDMMDECLAPLGTFIGGYIASLFCPCVWCAVAAYVVAFSMQMQKEANLRGGGEKKTYLHSQPGAANAAVNGGVQMVQVPQQQQYIPQGQLQPQYQPVNGQYQQKDQQMYVSQEPQYLPAPVPTTAAGSPVTPTPVYATVYNGESLPPPPAYDEATGRANDTSIRKVE